MQLTSKGEGLVSKSSSKRRSAAIRFLNGEDDINEYILKGVCFDSAAFFKFLMGENHEVNGQSISTTELHYVAGNRWQIKLGSEFKWKYGRAIPPGCVVTFYRLHDDTTFHAAVGIGGTKIRSTNGGNLGWGWQYEEDLTKHIIETDSKDNIYKYQGNDIIVYIQMRYGMEPDTEF